ncbi:MAG: hypothetical protein HY820_24305 [Acidobacteria bacterium]|nr:hypothetical protein [Acidobacteriota bacterium]
MRLALSALIGLVVMAAVGGIALFVNKGNHMELEGQIQKVRTLELDEKSSLVVVDFHVTNPADFQFKVKQVDVTVDAEGSVKQGETVAEVDARRIFDYYKQLGPKYNDSFKPRDVLNPKQSGDRMIAARFDIPEAKLAARRDLKLTIREADGQTTELREKR